MKKEWSMSNDKAIINFSVNYCTTDEDVLTSAGFRSVIEHFFKLHVQEKYARNTRLFEKHLGLEEREEAIESFIRLCKLLTIMSSKEISTHFKEFEALYENREDFRHLVEDVYNYWRKLERYSVIYEDKGTGGLIDTNFIESKEAFDRRILNMYRKISNNVSMTKPNVYRQVAAGTNASLILMEPVWPLPPGYEILRNIPFVKSTVMQAPFITYPKMNTRDGFFKEVTTNPLPNIGMNADHFFCFPTKVGDLLCFTFVHRDFLTHGLSLTNLFEMATPAEFSGRKPDLIVAFGANDPNEERKTVFYDDVENGILVGYVSHDEEHDYFGYMKKMILTLHNVVQIKRGNLPIHGAMVHIVMKDGSHANVVIMGDSGAGKSESIEAFRALSEDYVSDMTVIFDDMGTFRMNPETGRVYGYGTEIGAFVRLDDLDTGYAFKQLDRSIFMNPDKINARLITPVSTYEEITEGWPVDIFLYANNYDRVAKGTNAIRFFKSPAEAIPTFKAGRRMAKGTTTEKGLTTSYFANPFGPYQKQKECDVLIDRYFDKLFETDVLVGELKTQLAIHGFEKEGPEQAAINLFELIKKLAKKPID